MSNLLQELARATIRRAIKDFVSGSRFLAKDAREYFDSELFQKHRKIAEYPEELTDSVKELVLISKLVRETAAREILKALRTISTKN